MMSQMRAPDDPRRYKAPAMISTAEKNPMKRKINAPRAAKTPVAVESLTKAAKPPKNKKSTSMTSKPSPPMTIANHAAICL